jgi:hypothetical protein
MRLAFISINSEALEREKEMFIPFLQNSNSQARSKSLPKRIYAHLHRCRPATQSLLPGCSTPLPPYTPITHPPQTQSNHLLSMFHSNASRGVSQATASPSLISVKNSHSVDRNEDTDDHFDAFEAFLDNELGIGVGLGLGLFGFLWTSRCLAWDGELAFGVLASWAWEREDVGC